MSETESDVKKEGIGQLFGLFGVSDDHSEQQISYTSDNQREDGELLETDHTFDQNGGQIVKIDANVNENECIVCHSKEIKYRCPKCQTKSCSLSCCKTHKIRFNCDGIRDKLPFVKMSDFSQKQFLTDYFFLEDVDRVIDNNNRERRSIISSKIILPKWLQKLVREARLRGINLKIMPAGLSRRKQNSTCFMYNQKTINWDIEFKFVHAMDTTDASDLDQIVGEGLVVSHLEYTCLKSRVNENTTLLSLLSEFIESTDLSQNSGLDKKLCLYRKSGIEGISVLFKVENSSTKTPKYYEIDINKSIKENLSRKTVIEFPTFLVILKKFKDLFEIFDENVSEKTEK